jgi:predicted amidohydrolase YtcJ
MPLCSPTPGTRGELFNNALRGVASIVTEIVFYNGTVFDGTRFLERGAHVRVRDGRIVDVGHGQDLGTAELVDLAGGTLLPGFIDAHVHPVHAGNVLRHCDLRDSRNASDYVEIVAAYARDHPEEEWIRGGGWSMEAFPGGVPTRQALDAVVPDRPVFLPNRDGHGAWVNTKALQLAGIDRSTPDPADGRIERDSSGEPSGMLQEGAAGLVSRLLPDLTEDDWYDALLLAQTHLFSCGVTGWQDAIVGWDQGEDRVLETYLRAAGNGALQANVVGALWWSRERGMDQLPELVHQRGVGQAERFRATTIKMMLDGVAENHTAAMLEPYLDHEGCATQHAGLDFIDPQELPRFVSALDGAGFQVHFHALGDRAVRNALDAIEESQRVNGKSGRRHHLAHLQVVHPDDIPRFARLSATANLQALWAAHEPQMDELTIPFLGERRSGWQYPFRSLQAAGTDLCAGSDWPVSSPNPLWAAHVAVNRRSPGGADSDPFLPEQALDLPSFLAAYTSGSARVNGLDGVTGSIQEGLDADFAVVDADLAHIADHEIGDAAVVQTWARGEVVYGTE